MSAATHIVVLLEYLSTSSSLSNKQEKDDLESFDKLKMSV